MGIWCRHCNWSKLDGSKKRVGKPLTTFIKATKPTLLAKDEVDRILLDWLTKLNAKISIVSYKISKRMKDEIYPGVNGGRTYLEMNHDTQWCSISPWRAWHPHRFCAGVTAEQSLWLAKALNDEQALMQSTFWESSRKRLKRHFKRHAKPASPLSTPTWRVL